MQPFGFLRGVEKLLNFFFFFASVSIVPFSKCNFRLLKRVKGISQGCLLCL